MSFLEMCSAKYFCGACNNEVHDDEKAVQCENDCMLGSMLPA